MLDLTKLEGWLTIKEAANLTGKKEGAIRAQVLRGQLTAHKVPGPTGDRWLINPDSLGIHQNLEDFNARSYIEKEDRTISPYKNKGSQLKISQESSQAIEKIAELYERMLDDKDQEIQQKDVKIEQESRESESLRSYVRELLATCENFQKRMFALPAPEELKELKNERELLTNQINDLTKAREDLNKSNEELQNKLSSENEEITRARDTIKEKEQQLEKESKEKERLAQEKERLERELQEARLPWWKKLFN